ncbi:hypothetical protein HMPREF1980_02450 [Actinomyces sp. oral taxon 172 str. F0311]|nr:hypothetical protein HMPREF1980_02450 [Actinomyces sp. oral taxon 172 str. F0311]
MAGLEGAARPCWASGAALTAGVATNLGWPRWRGGITGGQLCDEACPRWGHAPHRGPFNPF